MPQSERRRFLCLTAILLGLCFGVAGWWELALATTVLCGTILSLLLPPADTPRLLWLALPPMLLSLLDLSLGEPSRARITFVIALSLPCVLVLRPLSRLETVLDRAVADRWFLAGLLVYISLCWAAISFQYMHFGERLLAQDTAYFEQCLWGYVTGRNDFLGSSQAWWRYDPPLTSHFAMHFSPVLYPVAWIYAAIPTYHILHLVQIVAIATAVVPLYLLLRRTDALAALILSVAYLVNPAVISQTQGAFHELALAAPVVAWTSYGLATRRFWLVMLGALAGILVREDLALVALMCSPAALLLGGWRVRRVWLLLPAVLGAVGWWTAGQVMRAHGANGAQVILALFQRFGNSPADILWGMAAHPMAVLQLLVEDHRGRYLLGVARPELLLGALHPISLLALPVTLINLLVRGAGTAWLEFHYSSYIPPALMTSAALGIAGFSHRLRALTRATPGGVRSALASLMLISSLLGFFDVFPLARLATWFPPVEEQEIHAILGQIPAEASVAAPRFMLHGMARRERLYMVNRWADYTRYDPEFIVVERDFTRVDLSDGTYAAYAAYAAYLSADARFETVFRGTHLIMYRDTGSSTPVLKLHRGELK